MVALGVVAVVAGLVRAVVALGVVAGLVPAVVALGVVAVWRQWLICWSMYWRQVKLIRYAAPSGGWGLRLYRIVFGTSYHRCVHM